MSKYQLVTRAVGHSSYKYFIIGLTAFGVDYIVLLFFYYVLKINLEVSTATGFLVGFAISFTANKQWVFGKAKQKKNLSRQITEYTFLLSFNFIFTVLAVNLLNNHGTRPVIGKLIVMVLIMCWNYALFRWVIFVAEKDKVSF